MEFKQWKKEEFEEHCRENFFMEDDDFIERLWKLIAGTKAGLDMDSGDKLEDGNTEGILVIKIREHGIKVKTKEDTIAV